MYLFLASEVSLFMSLLCAYVILRYGSAGNWRPAAQYTPSTFVGAINVLLLVTASGLCVLLLRPRSKSVHAVLTGISTLGLAYLLNAGLTYMSLFKAGLTPASHVFGTVFYLLTGVHALHVVAGIFWAYTVSFSPALRASRPHLQNLALYWHFINAVWVVLFISIYLI